MKRHRVIKTLAFLTLVSLKSFGQFDLKKEYPSLITTFVGGVFEGTSETLKWHYERFNDVFPNSNQNYWNPKYSGDNKYKNGLGKDGPKYFGSTTILVWTTDGYHMTRFVRNVSFATSIAIHPSYGKRKWYFYLIDFASHTIAYQIGFNTSYGLIFNKL